MKLLLHRGGLRDLTQFSLEDCGKYRNWTFKATSHHDLDYIELDIEGYECQAVVYTPDGMNKEVLWNYPIGSFSHSDNAGAGSSHDAGGYAPGTTPIESVQDSDSVHSEPAPVDIDCWAPMNYTHRLEQDSNVEEPTAVTTDPETWPMWTVEGEMCEAAEAEADAEANQARDIEAEIRYVNSVNDAHHQRGISTTRASSSYDPQQVREQLRQHIDMRIVEAETARLNSEGGAMQPPLEVLPYEAAGEGWVSDYSLANSAAEVSAELDPERRPSTQGRTVTFGEPPTTTYMYQDEGESADDNTGQQMQDVTAAERSEEANAASNARIVAENLDEINAAKARILAEDTTARRLFDSYSGIDSEDDMSHSASASGAPPPLPHRRTRPHPTQP